MELIHGVSKILWTPTEGESESMEVMERPWLVALNGLEGCRKRLSSGLLRRSRKPEAHRGLRVACGGC